MRGSLFIVIAAGLPVTIQVVIIAAVVIVAVVVAGFFLIRRTSKSASKGKAPGSGASDWQRQQAGPAAWNQQAGAGSWGQQQQQPAGAWGMQNQQQQPPGAWGQQPQQPAGAWGMQNQQQQPSQPDAWGAQNPGQQQATSPWGGQNSQSPAQQPAWGAQNAAPTANPWGSAAPTQNPWGQQGQGAAAQQGAGGWGSQPQQQAQSPWDSAPAAAPAQSWNSMPGNPQVQQGQSAFGSSNPSWNQQPAQAAQDPWAAQAAASAAPSWQQGGFGQNISTPGMKPDSGALFGSMDVDKTVLRSAGVPGQQAAGLGIIRVEEGKEPGRIYEIRKESLSIGRSRESDIFLEDLAVSRLHASILNMGNGNYALKDEGSANGTKVNGQLVNKYQTYQLQEGDRVQLGQTVLVFARR